METYCNKYIEDNKIKCIDSYWIAQLNKIKKYINENKKLPSVYSNDYKIKKLGKWIYQQQRIYKNKNNVIENSIFCKLWVNFIEEYHYYFKTKKEIWKENLNKVKQHIRAF
jgi:hypothetical protein